MSYGTKATAAAAAPTASLAYTGFNLGWWILAALTLIAAGIALRTIIRRKTL